MRLTTVLSSVLSFFLCTALLVCAEVNSPKNPYGLTVVTNRLDAIYRAGETVQFQIALSGNDDSVKNAAVSYVLTNDGVDILKHGEVICSDGKAVVVGTLDRPGFLLCKVTYSVNQKQSIEASAAAGLDPLQIQPAMPSPDDFELFWAKKLKQLRNSPINPEVTEVASPEPDVEISDVQLDCLNWSPASAYLAKPKGAKPKSLPAVLWVHGAHILPSFLDRAIRGAKMGMLSMDLNGHGFPNGKDAEFYKKHPINKLQAHGYYEKAYTYPYDGCEDRETSYFLGMYLRLIRALDFLKQQSEWDGKILIVRGFSQGGVQALVAGALDPQVTFVASGITAMCEHGGAIKGWPRFIMTNREDDVNARILNAVRYYDSTNFARLIQTETIMSVGFIDQVCPPTTVYAAYNSLTGKKRIVNMPLVSHEAVDIQEKSFDEAVLEHIAR